MQKFRYYFYFKLLVLYIVLFSFLIKVLAMKQISLMTAMKMGMMII